MILADDNFATIVKAVKEGRVVYDNLVKIILFALPTNFAQGFSILMALIIGLPVPLTPIQVLTVNMVTSVTLGLVLALEKPEPDVMSRKPRDPKTPILDGFTTYRTFVVTSLFVICMLGNQVRAHGCAAPHAVAQCASPSSRHPDSSPLMPTHATPNAALPALLTSPPIPPPSTTRAGVVVRPHERPHVPRGARRGPRRRHDHARDCAGHVRRQLPLHPGLVHAPHGVVREQVDARHDCAQRGAAVLPAVRPQGQRESRRAGLLSVRPLLPLLARTPQARLPLRSLHVRDPTSPHGA
jgi:fluoride ion exporter CrcB/FEX